MAQTQDLESIEELVCALPFVQFHIGAWTAMGPKLVELKKHPMLVCILRSIRSS